MLCVRPNCPQLTKLHLQKETHFIQFGTYTNMTVGQVYALDLTKHNGVLICLMARGPFFKSPAHLPSCTRTRRNFSVEDTRVGGKRASVQEGKRARGQEGKRAAL